MLNVISFKCGKNSILPHCIELLNEGCNRLLLEFCIEEFETGSVKINNADYTIYNSANVVEVPENLIVSGAKINVTYEDISFYLQVADETDGDMIVKQNGSNYDVTFFKKSAANGSGSCDCDLTKYYTKIEIDRMLVVDDELSLESENPVQNKVVTKRLEELFQYVSDGKRLIASAITEKQVPTKPDATFKTMHDNILAIKQYSTSQFMVHLKCYDGMTSLKTISFVNMEEIKE